MRGLRCTVDGRRVEAVHHREPNRHNACREHVDTPAGNGDHTDHNVDGLPEA